MKKIFSVLFLALLIIGCDMASDTAKLQPDIVITWVDPIGDYVDTNTTSKTLRYVYMVPRNSIDALLQGFIYKYYDANNTELTSNSPLFPLYAKIDGLLDTFAPDTTIIANLTLPVDSVVFNYLMQPGNHSAKAELKFVFTDQYEMKSSDTAVAWFGLYRLP